MSPWEPGPRLLGNLYTIILGTLTTFSWKTWEPCREPWRNLEGTFWEPWGNLEEPWEPWGNLGNLYLGTWEPWLGNLYLGTFTWEPLLGTWEPWGNGFWSCSGLLRNLYYGWRPQSILLLGKKQVLSSPKSRNVPYPGSRFCEIEASEVLKPWNSWNLGTFTMRQWRWTPWDLRSPAGSVRSAGASPATRYDPSRDKALAAGGVRFSAAFFGVWCVFACKRCANHFSVWANHEQTKEAKVETVIWHLICIVDMFMLIFFQSVPIPGSPCRANFFVSPSIPRPQSIFWSQPAGALTIFSCGSFSTADLYTDFSNGKRTGRFQRFSPRPLWPGCG